MALDHQGESAQPGEKTKIEVAHRNAMAVMDLERPGKAIPMLEMTETEIIAELKKRFLDYRYAATLPGLETREDLTGYPTILEQMARVDGRPTPVGERGNTPSPVEDAGRSDKA